MVWKKTSKLKKKQTKQNKTCSISKYYKDSYSNRTRNIKIKGQANKQTNKRTNINATYWSVMPQKSTKADKYEQTQCDTKLKLKHWHTQNSTSKDMHILTKAQKPIQLHEHVRVFTWSCLKQTIFCANMDTNGRKQKTATKKRNKY